MLTRPGYKSFNRAAYQPRQPQPRQVELFAPPRQPDEEFLAKLLEWWPVIIGVLSLLGAVVMVLTGNFLYAAVALLAGIAGLVYGLLNIVNNKRKNAKELQLYVDYLAQQRDEIRSENASFVRQLNAIDPAPSALLEVIAGGKGRHLWERQPRHSNFLQFRIGLEPGRSSSVTLNVPTAVTGKLDKSELDQLVLEMRNQLQTVADTPGLVGLREAEVFGLAGPRRAVYELACAVICQLVVHHSPEDVRLMLFYSPQNAAQWFWAGWLPHVQSLDPDATWPYMAGDNPKELAEVLRGLLESRRAKTRNGSETEKLAARLPYIVVVLDEAYSLEVEPGFLQYLYREGPPQNIFVICLANSDSELPGETSAFVNLFGNGSLQLTLNRRDGSHAIVQWQADALARNYAEKVALELAPLQLQQGGRGFVLPSSVNFFDLLGWSTLSGQQVAQHWASQSAANLELLLGVREDGQALLINLDESFHGTHGVVAGATGTGKGELLLTFVTSLALNNHPSRLNFILADFKGGATFSVFENLPHTVGLATDQIDEFGLNRFLISLRAELSRRKLLIDQAQKEFGLRVQKIRDFEKVAPERVFPFLLVIIDEFAELARTVPEMMDELVLIAQQGRSLGVFLLLSMQTTETLKGPIERNVRYRIALRMKEKSDSKEFIGDEGAANINGRIKGRAYFKCDDELYLFQTGRVMAYAASAASQTEMRVDTDTLMAVNLVDQNWRAVSLLENKSVKEASKTSANATSLTDAELAVVCCQQALNLQPLRQPLFLPWLKPLPSSIALTSLLPGVFADGHFQGWPERKPWLEVPLAVLDRYWEQRQPIIGTQFRQGRHLQFLGVQDSGRTPALLATILGLAATHQPHEIQFVLIDFGSTMSLFKALPHEPDYYSAGQFKDICVCIQDLVALMNSRQALYANGQTVVSSLEAYRALQQKQGVPPENQAQAVVVAIDNYTAWAQTDPDFYGKVLDNVKRLIQNGPTYGIYLVLTADRPRDIVGNQFAANFQTINLRMDASDLGVSPYNKKILAAWQSHSGRGLVENLPPYNLIETQCLNPVEADESGQLEGLQATILEMSKF